MSQSIAWAFREINWISGYMGGFELYQRYPNFITIQTTVHAHTSTADPKILR